MTLMKWLFAVTAFSTPAKIIGWTDLPNLTEDQAYILVQNAVIDELAVEVDGELCGIQNLREVRVEAPLASGRGPGEWVSLVMYVTGYDHDCLHQVQYDCHVVLHQPATAAASWGVSSTYCEAITPEFE